MQTTPTGSGARVPQNRYLIILTVLLTLFALAVILRGIIINIDNSTPATQQSPRTTNTNSTQQTGAPTKDTNTPTDRTVPSTSGGDANTILQP